MRNRALLIHRRLDLQENNLQFRGIYIWKISKKHTLEISKSNNFMVSYKGLLKYYTKVLSMFRTMKIHDVVYIYDWKKTKVEQEFLRHFKFS